MRITSWNLQGREGLDLDSVSATLVGLQPDIVVLQEVQRSQARALAARVGLRCQWWFKHWTVVYPAEGLAILTVEPLRESRRIHLAHRWRWWSWRRRIAVTGIVEDVRVVDVHLGSGVGDVERTRQAGLVLGLDETDRPAVIAGDFNTKPGSEVMDAFAQHGFRDAWTQVHPRVGYATNWRKGRRSGPPTQTLDYALIRGGVDVVDAVVGDSDMPDWTRFAALSDHAPLTVTLERRG